MIHSCSRCEWCTHFKRLVEAHDESGYPIIDVECKKRGIVKALPLKPEFKKRCPHFNDGSIIFVLDMSKPLDEWRWIIKE